MAMIGYAAARNLVISLYGEGDAFYVEIVNEPADIQRAHLKQADAVDLNYTFGLPSIRRGSIDAVRLVELLTNNHCHDQMPAIHTVALHAVWVNGIGAKVAWS